MAHLVIIDRVPTNLVFTVGVTQAAGGADVSATFTGVSFGTADATRAIIVGISFHGTSSSGAPSLSMTIGGVAATLIGQGNTGNGISVAMFLASIPTGTSGTVVCNASGNTFNTSVGICVWALYNAISTTPVQVATAGTGSTLALSLSASSFGIQVGFALCATNASVSFTWTGLAPDFNSGQPFAWISGAEASGATPLSITASAPALSGVIAGVSAAFA